MQDHFRNAMQGVVARADGAVAKPIVVLHRGFATDDEDKLNDIINLIETDANGTFDFIRNHNSELLLYSFNGDLLHAALGGHCVGCVATPGSQRRIENAIQEMFPEVDFKFEAVGGSKAAPVDAPRLR